MKEATIEPKNEGVTEEELAAIAKFSRRPLKAEEVYTFSLVLCDNDLDRDFECFTKEALGTLGELFVGRTGIFDHDPSGEKQNARIYKTWVEEEEGRLNFLGEPYLALHARAYMVRTAKNADLILEIDAGIKKEVSVGCAVEKATCSICGADRRKEPCAHQPGKRYQKALCYTRLSEPSDAYEWSFVAVPSQPAAGVTKSHGAAKALRLTPERALLQMETGELHLDRASAEALRAHIGVLEEKSLAGERYREELLYDVRRFTLLTEPDLSAGLLEKSLAPLSVEELRVLRELAEKRADRRFAPRVQTAPDREAPEQPFDHYKI